MSSSPKRIVIVGGGVAGHEAALALRDRGFDGKVTIVSEERHLPYDRTLLSKAALVDETVLGSVELGGSDTYEELGVEVRLATRVARVLVGERKIETSSGARLGYDSLIICTGGRPRMPRAFSCRGVLTLRREDDIAGLREALREATLTVVVGAGFLGGELASAARQLDGEVHLIEALPEPLANVLGQEVGARIARLHRDRGVRLRTGVRVVSIRQRGRGFSVGLSDGQMIRADRVVAALGMEPSVEWLTRSGVELSNGIVCDARCRTTVPGVFAAGDCARWWNPRYSALMRVEHWDTAARHGASAGAAVVGVTQDFDPVPFFWSDLHGVKIQAAGYFGRWDSVSFSAETESDFVARYFRGDRMVAAVGVGAARTMAAVRKALWNSDTQGEVRTT